MRVGEALGVGVDGRVGEAVGELYKVICTVAVAVGVCSGIGAAQLATTIPTRQKTSPFQPLSRDPGCDIDTIISQPPNLQFIEGDCAWLAC